MPSKGGVPAIITPKPSALAVIKDGFGFGVGSAIAHRAVGGLFNQEAPKKPERNIVYEQCMLDHIDHIFSATICERYLTEAKHTTFSK